MPGNGGDMKSRIEEKLHFVREHLASVGTTPQKFNDDGTPWESLEFEHAYQLESFAHSWGYLEGAADMADLTIVDLLQSYRLTLNEPKKRPRCPKCGGKSHRCKTGDAGCRHCDDEKCGHGWREQ